MKIVQRELEAALRQSLARHHVPGASVAVFHGGELTTAAAGVTNVNTGVEITPGTVMHIGSITKIFNATLVMQLVDEGRVDLEERVVRYLPDLKLKDGQALEQITVKMLLNHTSGIDGDILPDYGHDEETIERGIERFAQLGSLFEPGTEFSYCNAATVIAGYLAQRLTGKSWYTLVRERIFEPLQLEHAATLPEEALLHRASVGHYFKPASTRKVVRTSFAFLPLSWAPCGTTLMTSATDLITFARAHMAGGVGPSGTRILSAASTKAMRQMTVDNRGKGYNYTDGIGIGWMVCDDGLTFHSGGGPGIGSTLYVYPERGFAAAILTNGDNCLGVINELMAPWLSELGTTKLLGMADIQPRPELAPSDPDNYTGVYEDVVNRYRISRGPHGLMLSRQAKFAPYENISLEETPPGRLVPVEDGRFLWEPDGNEGEASAIAFRVFAFRNRDARGRVQFLASNGRLYPRARER
jgi:CubicO group peptidase (beta-lactamase class C family)